MAGGLLSGGTGEKLGHASIVIAGVAALVASLLSFVYVVFSPVWLKYMLMYCITARYGYRRRQLLNPQMAPLPNQHLVKTTENLSFRDMSYEYCLCRFPAFVLTCVTNNYQGTYIFSLLMVQYNLVESGHVCGSSP